MGIRALKLFNFNYLHLILKLCWIVPMRTKIPSEVQSLRELLLTQARQILELIESRELLECENAELSSCLGKISRTCTALPVVMAIARRLRFLRYRCNAGFADMSSRSRTSAPGEASRQVFDLRAVRLRGTEHRLSKVCCF